MRGAYKDLVNIRVRHEYYSDRISNDLDFHPIPKTEKKLAGHGLLFMSDHNGFKVVYPSHNTSNEPFIPIEASQDFSFAIHLKNLEFFNFTKVAEKRGFVSFFSNRIHDLEEIKTDHSKFAKANHLHHYFADTSTVSSLIGLDPLTYQNNAFGFVQIFNDALKEPDHSISFETQSKVWKYFVVLPHGSDGNEYVIQKKNSQPADSRYKALQISFLNEEPSQLEDGRTVLPYSSGIQVGTTGVFDAEGQPIEGEPFKGLIDCPKRVAIPKFEQEAKPSNEYLKVYKHKERTTNHYTFKRIVLEDCSTLTFTREWVSVHELICKGEATIKFQQDTKLYVREKLELGEDCNLNPTSRRLLCLVGKKNAAINCLSIKIGNGSVVNGVFFTYGTLEIEPRHYHHHHHYHHYYKDDDDDDDDDKRKSSHRKTEMNGVFIAGRTKDQDKAEWNLVKNTWDNPHSAEEVKLVPIPFYEEKLRNLQLIKKNSKRGLPQGTSVVFKNLPNPSIGDLKPELFIYL